MVLLPFRKSGNLEPTSVGPLKERFRRKEGLHAKVVKGKIVEEVFGEDVNPQEKFPPIEKVVVLLWLFRDDDEVIRYLTGLMEMHMMKKPSLVDHVEVYIPQLTNFVTHWQPKDSTKMNPMEHMLLVLAQLSSRFALQYHWSLQSYLFEQRPEIASSGRRNPDFDIIAYARCMAFAANLDRCMNGKERPASKRPTLEIVQSYGGKVTNDEFVAVEKSQKEESSKEFFEGIVTAADNNVSILQDPPSDGNDDLTFPMKGSFGGVLLFKRQYRKTGRRKQWKHRYFAIEEGMLNCYSRNKEFLRSLPLDGATIWKGPQAKYPHSFIVANDDVMFYLRASTEKQKALWKDKLFQVIKENSTSENLSPTQLERKKIFQNGKWFGHMLVETTQDLDSIARNERAEFLYEHFFELEMSKHILWPWRDDNSATDKQVYVILPHFSRLVDTGPVWSRTSSLPRFQASFWLKENKNDGKMASFLSEGYNINKQENSDLPGSIIDTLKTQHASRTQEAIVMKTTDGDSSMGDNSTEGTSSNTDEEFIMGTENSDEEDPTESGTGLVKRVEIEYIGPVTVSGQPYAQSASSNDSSNVSSVSSLNEDSSHEDGLSHQSNSVETHDSCTSEQNVHQMIDFPVEVQYREVLQPFRKAQEVVTLRTKPYRHDEFVALQLMTYFSNLLSRKEVDIWTRPPHLCRLNKDTAILEIPREGVVTLNEAKHALSRSGCFLREYLIKHHGPENSSSFILAQQNFVTSLAGMSLMSYILGLKERHDDNLMLDQQGHIFALDHPCVFGADPVGLGSALEVAPIKLRKEYLSVMDSPKSKLFQKFKESFISGLTAAREDAITSTTLLETASMFKESIRGKELVRFFRQRLLVDEPDDGVEKKASHIIQQSQQRFTPTAYDLITARSSTAVEV